MEVYRARLGAVQQQMAADQIDLMFLPRSASLHYLTGIPRDEQPFGNTVHPGEWVTGAWISPSRAPVLTLPRMTADFHLGVADYDVRVLGDTADPYALLRDLFRDLGVGSGANVAVEERAWAETLIAIESTLGRVRFRSSAPLIMPLRMIKDAEEIALMRRAGEITELAYQATLDKLKPGMTTLDLISEVNYQLRLHGAETNSFTTSFYNMGPTFPFDFHNRDEVLRLPLNPPVAVSYDFGAVYRGYCYDYGRSVFFGEPDAEYRRAYALVMDAQAVGIAALRAGNTAEAVDAARPLIVEWWVMGRIAGLDPM
ncbi:MAG: aminopeptidase P family protein, partial [Oscillochloris sp.]|nr:aminopeptidase P family protein [Oscillochloris sp.]